MAEVYLKAEERDLMGKQQVKHLRKEGVVPGIVYGKKIKNESVQVSHEDLIKILHTSAGENAIIKLDIIDKNGKATNKSGSLNVILKEIQQHPITTDIIHVDFAEISLTEKIEVKVQIKIKGEPVGVVKDNGVFEAPLRELSIECLPTDIPEEITVDVESLEIGDTLHVKDIVSPKGVSILDDPERTVVLVAAPKEEEEEEEEEEEVLEEPEVIGEKEREEKREQKEVEKETKEEEQKEDKVSEE